MTMPNVILVGKSRRITLPKEFNIAEGDKMNFVINDKGQLIFTPIRTAPIGKIKLYAVIIGRSITSGRYFGVIMDSNGIIGARVNSSSEQYLIQDMTLMQDKDVKSKLNKKFGENNWERPIYRLIISPEMHKVANDLEIGLRNGTWPPTKAWT